MSGKCSDCSCSGDCSSSDCAPEKRAFKDCDEPVEFVMREKKIMPYGAPEKKPNSEFIPGVTRVRSKGTGEVGTVARVSAAYVWVDLGGNKLVGWRPKDLEVVDVE